jgi:hypothetical protein
METMRECYHLTCVIEYLEANGIDPYSVICELYSDEPDERIGWNKTYVVMGRHKSMVQSSERYPLAFSDKPFTINFT